MKKMFIAVIVGLGIFSSFGTETTILSKKYIKVNSYYEGKILHVKASDGHEYIIVFSGGVNGGTFLIHAVGCNV